MSVSPVLVKFFVATFITTFQEKGEFYVFGVFWGGHDEFELASDGTKQIFEE